MTTGFLYQDFISLACEIELWIFNLLKLHHFVLSRITCSNNNINSIINHLNPIILNNQRIMMVKCNHAKYFLFFLSEFLLSLVPTFKRFLYTMLHLSYCWYLNTHENMPKESREIPRIYHKHSLFFFTSTQR